MKVVKKELPEGVKKKFVTKIGKKVKIVNTLYLKNKKNKKAPSFTNSRKQFVKPIINITSITIRSALTNIVLMNSFLLK